MYLNPLEDNGDDGGGGDGDRTTMNTGLCKSGAMDGAPEEHCAREPSWGSGGQAWCKQFVCVERN